ncbi:UNVERIFIED_CONTAM: hypothetical protein Sradi_6191800 [Sesamum radiatum]|uniref:Uncharacterized protein n=1 Tax=Sesamum radiatum TaxID=300843 RepID=A0AAW2K9F9_SESRA
MSISRGHDEGLQEPILDILNECLEYPKGMGIGRAAKARTAYIGVRTVERFRAGTRLPHGLRDIRGNTSRANE